MGKVITGMVLSLYIPITLGVIGEENMMLLEIVGNTAQQINELEKLVTETEKHTKAMREAYEMAEDRVYFAQRFYMWSKDMGVLLTDPSAKSLNELNQKIKDFKMNRQELRDMHREVSVGVRGEKWDEKKAVGVRGSQKKLVKKYARDSTKVKRGDKATELIAKNTGASTYELSKVNLNLIESNKKMSKLRQDQLKLRQDELEKEKEELESVNDRERGILR